MLSRVNQLLKQFAIRAPHLFYTVPLIVCPLAFYAYRRAKCLQMSPEAVVPFRHYYYVVRPQDVRITEENALAYNWEDLRTYRNQFYPHMDRLPGLPREPGLLPLKPYPRVTMEIEQELEPL